MTRPTCLSAACVCAIACWPALAVAQNATFQGLGVLPNTTSSTPVDVSADGAAVTGRSGNYGFIWTPDHGLEDIGSLDGSANVPVAIAGNGSRVVGRAGNGYVWTRVDGIRDLGNLPGTSQNYPVAISGDGGVVAGFCAQTRLYRWTPGAGLTELPASPDDRTLTLTALSYDGSTEAGVLSSRSPHEVFRVRNGHMELLPIPAQSYLGAVLRTGVLSDNGELLAGRARSAAGGLPPTIWNGSASVAAIASDTDWSVPVAMSADGSVVVGNIPQTSSFIYRNGQYQTLTMPERITLTGVSADGAIVVGTARRTTASPIEAVLAVGGQVRWLSDELAAHGAPATGWTLSTVRVSRDGSTFVGDGTSPTGGQAWRATLPR